VSQLSALARVLKHRVHELDQEIVRSTSERESAFLWRLRTSVRKLIKALAGHSPARRLARG
jgi:hypothetical protein